MKTSIYIKGLEIFARHGVFIEEKRLGQKFIIDIKCELDYSLAMITDELNHSVSYGDIAEDIFEIVTKTNYSLLEKLAYDILKNIFDKYEKITKINIKINKPNAPISKTFRECGVEVEIDRVDFNKLKKGIN